MNPRAVQKMPSILNVCTQPLDEQGQARPCPCRYTRKCPDSTVKCDYGERYCKNCYTDENGKFHHEPAKLKDGTFFPCNNFAPFSRDCNLCAFNYKRPFYSSILGEYRPFEQRANGDTDGDLPF